jgi:SP family sugar:H+ symporter-like MFS transporter
MMVASLMLFFFFYLLAWAPLPYIILGEVSSRTVVEKTNSLAVSLPVVTALLVSFTVPYLIGVEHANLGGKVGFIYGSISIVVAILTFIVIPETKGPKLGAIG